MRVKSRFMEVRPLILPDFSIELMYPSILASLYFTGSITVTVNLSPTRADLLDNVSFKRTFRFVPAGTLTVVGVGAGLVTVVRCRVVRRRCVVVVFFLAAEFVLPPSCS